MPGSKIVKGVLALAVAAAAVQGPAPGTVHDAPLGVARSLAQTPAVEPLVDATSEHAGAGTVTLTVVVPAGSLSITPEPVLAVDPVPVAVSGGALTGRVRAVVTDTRAGHLGFTVSATVEPISPPPARRPWLRRGPSEPGWSLVDVAVVQVPGNALLATDLVTSGDRGPVERGTHVPVATYASGTGLGSVVLEATVVADGPHAWATPVRVVWTVM